MRTDPIALLHLFTATVEQAKQVNQELALNTRISSVDTEKFH